LSNIAALSGKADASRLIVLSQESGKIVNVDRAGNISSSLTIETTAGDTLTVPNQSHEGITVDKNGNIYVVSENGGGDVDHPQLWVYAPTKASTPLVNQAPTAVTVGSVRNTIADKTNTTARVKVSDITITDDGLGTNNLTLTGTDTSSLEIFNNALYVKAGTSIDYSVKNNYSVVVNVDDPTVGSTPDLVKTFILEVSNPTIPPTTGGIFVTEVAPWSSGNSPIGADWFELTNTSKTAINIEGWKFDDNSNNITSGLTLNGITSIGAGESVVFVEATTVTGAIDAFKNNWFGANVPAGFKIGSYSGTGNGLSTGGDAVNIYDAGGVLQANVVFGASPALTPFATFTNPTLVNNGTITDLSAVGVNGGFSIVNSLSATEIGSPGSFTTSIPVTPITRNDFNGDSKSDILWRSDIGGVSMWQMNGSTVTSTSLTSTPNLATSWKSAGTGDFNGDGKSDILWRNDSGAVAVWTMNGSTVVSSSLTSTPNLATSWKAAGTGDFDGDGKSDILWRNDSGAVAIWKMDGTNAVSSLTSTPTLAASWKAAGTGDFNGDGKSDILWRNDDGSVALWQMNGSTVVSSSLTSTPSLDSSWKINGTADFNGDGKADILWRNTNTGAVDIWQMNGATVLSSSLTSTPSLDSTWKIAGTGDFNGDTKADILWRKDSGATDVWTMNGSTVVSSTLTSTQPLAGSAWQIAAPIL
jgi:predicted  nucleic acid-binding Zn ribbon protein